MPESITMKVTPPEGMSVEDVVALLVRARFTCVVVYPQADTWTADDPPVRVR